MTWQGSGGGQDSRLPLSPWSPPKEASCILWSPQWPPLNLLWAAAGLTAPGPGLESIAAWPACVPPDPSPPPPSGLLFPLPPPAIFSQTKPFLFLLPVASSFPACPSSIFSGAFPSHLAPTGYIPHTKLLQTVDAALGCQLREAAAVGWRGLGHSQWLVQSSAFDPLDGEASRGPYCTLQ